MKVIEGIKKYKEPGIFRDWEIEMAEKYLEDKNNIDSYACFKFWKYYKNYDPRYLNFFYEIIKDWDDFSKSPYSKSFYSSSDIDWNFKPEGSYRIADHWNFKSQGEIHCKMEDETKNNELLLCRYENGIYKIVRELKKDLMKIYD